MSLSQREETFTEQLCNTMRSGAADVGRQIVIEAPQWKMTWMPGLLKGLAFGSPTKALRRQEPLDPGPWRLWDRPAEDLRKQDVSAFVSSSSGQLGRLPRLFEACLVLRPTLTRSCLGFKGSK